jgi:putative two-component system response regulator
MVSNNPPDASSDHTQLRKYAQDLARLYRSEREKKQQLHATKQQLVKYADELSQTILELKETHDELHRAFLDTIHRLVLAAEYKDEDTGDHILRMSRYSALIAQKLSLSDTDVQLILYASPMHDLGKIGIPDSILLKPGKLTEEEFGIMKTHTIIGANILAYSKVELIQIAEQIALSHHEKWNGKGYPQGLVGERIHIAARIVGLVDVFDVLTSKRPYKDPYPVEKALDIITKERGEHFDPNITDVFLKHIDEIIGIKHEVGLAQAL